MLNKGYKVKTRRKDDDRACGLGSWDSITQNEEGRLYEKLIYKDIWKSA